MDHRVLVKCWEPSCYWLDWGVLPTEQRCLSHWPCEPCTNQIPGMELLHGHKSTVQQLPVCSLQPGKMAILIIASSDFNKLVTKSKPIYSHNSHFSWHTLHGYRVQLYYIYPSDMLFLFLPYTHSLPAIQIPTWAMERANWSLGSLIWDSL